MTKQDKDGRKKYKQQKRNKTQTLPEGLSELATFDMTRQVVGRLLVTSGELLIL